MALNEHVKARFRLSDVIRSQKNDKTTSNVSKWIRTGAKEKGDLEEESLVPGALEPLLDMGRGRKSVTRAFCGELDACVTMDRGERDETSRVESTNSGVNTCHRLQPEASVVRGCV